MARQNQVSDDPFELLADDYFFDLPISASETKSSDRQGRPRFFRTPRAPIASGSTGYEGSEISSQRAIAGGLSEEKQLGGKEQSLEPQTPSSEDSPDSSSPEIRGFFLGLGRAPVSLKTKAPSFLNFPLGRLDSQRMRPLFLKGTLALGFLGVIVAGILWITPRGDKPSPFAYVEMRAIGPQGRPVAGAAVKRGDTLLGYTDSFGEWRQYMKVRPGQTMVVSFSKESAEGFFQATKNIAVPLSVPESGEFEIRAQIGLLRQGTDGPNPVAEEKVREGFPHKTPDASEPQLVAGYRDDSLVSSISDSDKTLTGSDQNQDTASLTEASSDLQRSSSEADHVAIVQAKDVRENQTDAQGSARDGNFDVKTEQRIPGIWIASGESSKGSQDALGSLVLGLREAFQKGGFRVHPKASLQLVLHHLQQQDTTRLLHVSAQVALASPTEKGEGGRRSKTIFSFLRGVPSDMKVAPDDVVRALVRYGVGLPWSQGQSICEEEVPCAIFSPPIAQVPPQPQWQKMSFKTAMPLVEGTEVYVSGFAAQPVDGQRYEFWAPPEGPVNVTIVRGFEVVYRGKMVPSSHQGMILPQPLYSRIGLKAAPAGKVSKM